MSALVELDEVKVHARAHTGRKQLLALTAMVLSAGRCWHLAAPTSQELIYQVGALLAVLGVHRGTRRLPVPADGARWIRDWFEALGLADKAMIVCRWHVVKRVQQDLSRACSGREHRRTVETAVLQALWHGRVEEALEVLRSRAGASFPSQALTSSHTDHTRIKTIPARMGIVFAGEKPSAPTTQPWATYASPESAMR